MTRKITFRGVVAALAFAAVSGLVNLNVQHYARGTPLEKLLDFLSPGVRLLREITTDPRFLVVTSLLVGGSVALFADAILRRWAVWRDALGGVRITKMDRRLMAMTLVLFFGTGLTLSIIWLAVESRMRRPVASLSLTANGADSALSNRLAKAEAENSSKDELIASLRQALTAEREAKKSAELPTGGIASQSLSADDIATKLSIWDSVATSYLNALILAFNDLDGAQARWVALAKTEAGRSQLHSDLLSSTSRWQSAGNEFYTLREAYTNYSDVADVLNQQGNVDRVAQAAQAFANAVSRVPNDTPADTETKLRPLAGALKREMDRAIGSIQKMGQTAGAKRNELSRAQ